MSDVEGSTRASVNGPVDSKITYEKWLKEQSEDFQKQVLGKTRFKLFKQGQSLSSFVDNGKVLTLEELKSITSKSERVVFNSSLTVTDEKNNINEIKKIKKELSIYAENVNLNGNINSKNLNEVKNTLDIIHKEIGLKKLKNINFNILFGDVDGDSTAADASFEILNVGKLFLTNPKEFWKTAYGEGYSKYYKDVIETSKRLIKNKKEELKIILKNSFCDTKKIEFIKNSISEFENFIQDAKENLKYSRHNVIYESQEIKCTIFHECGHIISDQKIGLINGTIANKNLNYKESNILYQEIKNVEKCFEIALNNKDIYKLSKYASTDVDEFFAECFTIYKMKKEVLPKYLEEMVERILNVK